MTIYRYEPVRDLANTEAFGSVTFEVKGWQEPRIEEAKNELIKVLTPKLEELKQDPEKNRYSIEFIQHQTIDFQLTGK